MTIITPFGDLNSNDAIKSMPEIKEIIQALVETAELFFQEEIEVEDQEQLDNIETAWLNTFNRPEKVKAFIEIIANPRLIDVHESVDYDNKTEQYAMYSNEETGEDYLIYTDAEANLALENYLANNLEVDSMEYVFGSGIVETAAENPELYDTYYLDSKMYSDMVEQLDELDDADSDNPIYISKLHEKFVKDGKLPKPQWPSDESEKRAYQKQMISDVYDLKHDAATEMEKEFENSTEWYLSKYDITDLVKEIDAGDWWYIPKVISWVVKEEMFHRGVLNYRDGIEDSIIVNHNGKAIELFYY